MSSNESVHSGSNGRQAGTAAASPDPEVVPKASRRKFTAEYKLRILVEADACDKHGGIGALLRREGRYRSHLDKWRKQLRQGSGRPCARAWMAMGARWYDPHFDPMVRRWHTCRRP